MWGFISTAQHTMSSLRRLAFASTLVAFFAFNVYIVYSQQADVQQMRTPAHVRVAHLSSDTPPVDLLVDEYPTNLKALPYTTFSDWYSLPSGIHTLGLTTTSGPTGTVNLILEPESWTTIALVGSTERETLQIQVIQQDSSELRPGEARLNFFHAVEDIPSIDVLANDDLLFQFVSYPQGQGAEATSDGFTSVDLIANTYDLTIILNSHATEPLLTVDALSLAAMNTYFIALVGTSEEPGVLILTDGTPTRNITPLQSAPSPSPQAERWLRVAHLASGGGPVHLREGDRSIATVNFADVTPYLLLNETTPTLTLTSDIMPISPNQLDLSGYSSQWLTVVIIASQVSGELTVRILEDNYNTLAAQQTRLGVFQGIPANGPVNVLQDDGSEKLTLIRLLGYPGSQGNNDGYQSVDLLAGTYTLQIVSSANPEDVLVTLENQQLVEGRSYFMATIRAEPPYVLSFDDIQQTESP